MYSRCRGAPAAGLMSACVVLRRPGSGWAHIRQGRPPSVDQTDWYGNSRGTEIAIRWRRRAGSCDNRRTPDLRAEQIWDGGDRVMADGGCETAGTAGVLVRRWRAAAGLTQQELAMRAGVSVGAVRDLEQGRVTRPQSRVLERLAGALGLDSGQRADLAAAAAGMTGRSRRPGAGLWLRVLGTAGCWHGGVPVLLGPARQRAVLAFLAMHPNTDVGREALIDALWPGGPPGSAVAVIQSHVARLRKVLDGGLPGRAGRAVLAQRVPATGWTSTPMSWTCWRSGSWRPGPGARPWPVTSRARPACSAERWSCGRASRWPMWACWPVTRRWSGWPRCAPASSPSTRRSRPGRGWPGRCCRTCGPWPRASR